MGGAGFDVQQVVEHLPDHPRRRTHGDVHRHNATVYRAVNLDRVGENPPVDATVQPDDERAATNISLHPPVDPNIAAADEIAHHPQIGADHGVHR